MNYISIFYVWSFYTYLILLGVGCAGLFINGSISEIISNRWDKNLKFLDNIFFCLLILGFIVYIIRSLFFYIPYY